VRRQRSSTLVVRLALRADRGQALAVGAMLMVSILVGTTFPIWAQTLVTAVSDGSGAVWAGLAGMGVSLLLTLATGHVAVVLASRFQPRMARAIDDEIERMAFEIPDSRQLERVETTTALRALAAGRTLLSRGFLLIVQTAAALIRFLVILVLLGNVSLVLVPLAAVAVPSVLLSAAATRRGTARDAEVAGRFRRAAELFAAFVGEAGQRDLSEPGQRHWFAERLVSAAMPLTRRPDLRASLLTTSAWLLYGAVFAVGVTVVASSPAGAAGDVVLVVLMMGMVRDQVGGIIGLQPTLQQLAGVAAHLLTLRRAAQDHSPASRQEARLTDGITCAGLGFAVDGHVVLHSVDLRLPPGSVVSVCGSNGSGKTTLLRLLAGIYTPTSGRITGVPPHDDLALLSQHPVQVPASVRDNVALGVAERLMADEDVTGPVVRAIDTAGMTRHVRSLPNGIATRISTSGSEGIRLSGGQAQGLAIARALVRHRPALRLLDEPASALDPESEVVVMRQITERARADAAYGTTTVIVSHRLATVVASDLVLFLDRGRLMAFGPHARLLETSPAYRQLYTTESGLYR
jgi:ATP-binding cassette subfamily B protein